jgi:hypothetical protein
MFEIKYDRLTNTTRIETKNLNILGEDKKIKVEIVNIITNQIHYTTELGSHMWSEWKGGDVVMSDVKIYDDNWKHIYTQKWDVLLQGDEIEKNLWVYLKKRQNLNFKSRGLIIGTHDGRNGHWIYPIKEGLSDAVLVDGSETQFKELLHNYRDYTNVEFINEIITPDGKDVEWFQGGEGYTDSVFKDIPSIYLNDNQITKQFRKSISINELMKKNDFDWIHLDVEGLDADLILALENTPNVIIFESMNLKNHQLTDLKTWFKNNNYEHLESDGNIIAFQK